MKILRKKGLQISQNNGSIFKIYSNMGYVLIPGTGRVIAVGSRNRNRSRITIYLLITFIICLRNNFLKFKFNFWRNGNKNKSLYYTLNLELSTTFLTNMDFGRGISF